MSACALLAGFILAGCASGEAPPDAVGFHTFLHESRPPHPAGTPVDIFTNGLPSRSFDRVAILDAHCESQFFATPSMRDAIPILVREARLAGCDAVIEIQQAGTPANWTLETRVKHYTGIGVAYK